MKHALCLPSGRSVICAQVERWGPLDSILSLEPEQDTWRAWGKGASCFKVVERNETGRVRGGFNFSDCWNKLSETFSLHVVAHCFLSNYSIYLMVPKIMLNYKSSIVISKHSTLALLDKALILSKPSRTTKYCMWNVFNHFYNLYNYLKQKLQTELTCSCIFKMLHK